MTAKENWKPVTIGGLTGILMGAGAIYGIQAMASDGEENPVSVESGLKVASVSEDMSFNKAFEVARAEIGPGGVFTWRGHIYNTYTAEEWNAMSNNDKQLFADQIKPEITAADIDTKQVAENAAVEEVQPSEDVQVAQNVEVSADTEVEQSNDVEARVNLTSWNEIAQEENDVRVVGFKEVTVGPGRTINMQELDINGQRVAVIDVDKDGVPDLAMTDLNHNQQMDEGEVIDLHTGEAISFANDESAVSDTPDTDQFTV